MNSDSLVWSISRIRWQGQIKSVQCPAWIWRYKLDNRTHHHIGFNLFLKGEADGRAGRFALLHMVQSPHRRTSENLPQSCVEIDAQPEELDLLDILAEKTGELGLMASVLTHAHQKSDFDLMRFGIEVFGRPGPLRSTSMYPVRRRYRRRLQRQWPTVQRGAAFSAGS